MLNLRHIVMPHCYGVAVVPLDRDPAPCNSSNGAVISRALVPAHAVTDFELSGLFAGHKIRRISAGPTVPITHRVYAVTFGLSPEDTVVCQGLDRHDRDLMLLVRTMLETVAGATGQRQHASGPQRLLRALRLSGNEAQPLSDHHLEN